MRNERLVYIERLSGQSCIVEGGWEDGCPGKRMQADDDSIGLKTPVNRRLDATACPGCYSGPLAVIPDGRQGFSGWVILLPSSSEPAGQG